MLELNDNIKWIPDNVKHGQFGKWLEGARDWSISRNRFWGAPIPVWVSDNPDYPRTEVYGSVAELQTAFADCLTTDPEALKAYPSGQIDDLHRPKIDTLWRTNPDDPSGKSKMVRITDVFDCWFESGAMPFASVHYPFDNKQWFEEHYPSDFIVEYIGQTRGWFYTLHIMATALFDCNAFKNVMCHGIVLGDDGQKMSKSLRNYPDVRKVFDLYGSDAMRWFLMSSNILRGGNLSVTETAIKDTVRNTLLPLWNSYYFFTMYANSSANGAGIEARRLEPRDYPKLQIQDRYILSKLRPLLENVTANLKQFEVAAATENFRDFFDVLTNWYIRTQRERFWKEDQLAFDTLWTVLEFLTRALSPLLPLTAEEIWRGLTGGESVHLMNYPALELDRNADETLIYDAQLTEAVDLVRDIVSTTLSLRKNSNIRVRQPLQLLQVAVANPQQVQEFVEILRNELNLKDVELLDADQVQMEDYGLSNQLVPNARVLGPRLGKRVQDIIRSAKSGKWHLAEGVPIVQLDDGDVDLKGGEYTLNVVVGNEDDAQNVDQVAATLKSGGFVKLDLKLTEQLLHEGIARDLIRQIQEQRKLSGFDISDRIHLQLVLPEQKAQAAQEFKDLIASEVLAVQLDVSVGEEVVDMQVA
jgi:isoleucyl-tRNA synthetase